MNIDTGAIRLWSELTPSEKESGRWVKLGDNELATAVTIEEHERHQRLAEIFAKSEKEMNSLADKIRAAERNRLG